MTTPMLTGIRVLDLAGEPLARAGRILADLGADVILVEPPEGSPARRIPPLVQVPSGEVVSPPFAYTAAGKRSITVNLEVPAGYQAFCRLVSTADVVLVSDSPDDLRRRKINYETLRSVNDRIILVSLTPFGLSGPRRHWRGSELIAWASSGALMSIGDPDRRPLAPGGGLAYAAGSLNAVAGTLMALLARKRNGRGQMVDISLQEAVMSVSMEGGPLQSLEGASQVRVGTRRGPGQGQFATKDGFVELLPFMAGQWDALAEWIREDVGIEEATLDTFRGSTSSRLEFGDLINGWVDQLAGRFTKQDFFIEAQRRGIPTGPVNEAVDLLTDPQLAAVDGWAEVDYPGVGPIRSPRPPLRFGDSQMEPGAVPSVGQHNDDIYRELGLDDSIEGRV